MSNEVQEDIVFSNLITLNFTYIEQRLRKNFEIIASRMSKLQGLMTLDDRVRTLEKQSKFMSMKVDNIVMRLPQNSANIDEDDVRNICNQRITEYMSPTNQSIKSTKLFTELKAQIEKSIMEKGKRKGSFNEEDAAQKKQGKQKEGAAKTQNSDQNAVLNYGKVSKQILEKHLNRDEMLYVDKLLKEEKPIQQIILETAAKLQSLERHFEQARMSRGVLSMVQRDVEKFDKYETFDQRYERHQKKLRGTTTDMRATSKDADFRVTTKDGDMRATARESQMRITGREDPTQSSHGVFAPNPTLKDSRRLATSRKAVFNVQEGRGEEQQNDDTERQRISKKNRSLSKLVMPERTERRLRLEDPKDLTSIIREIEVRLENKVSKEVFTNVIQDLQDRLQALRHTRSSNTDMELRRYCNSVENRLQAVITFIQQNNQDDDPLIAKKKWTCISCDKQAEKYAAKVGNHLNWDTLNSKRLSPTKAGAFGQTVVFANKVKSIIEQRRGADVSDVNGGGVGE